MRVLLNLRTLKGEIVERRTINFEASNVCNYLPPDDFEGSVEVEAFSIKNMRIPYAAVMAVYETSKSVSMVHSYARAYSQHEVEEKRTISDGEESCWTLRDNSNLTSFAIIHNGPNRQESQNVKLSVRNSSGNELTTSFQAPELLPFETLVIEPKNYFLELNDFLGGEAGNGRVSFKLNGGFTRMLCGVKSKSNDQIQVTHSNFDYSTHGTDTITSGEVVAYMRTPNLLKKLRQEIVVYPDTHNGIYKSEYDGELKEFSTGQIHRLKFDDNCGKFVKFSRNDKILPTRIVTALRLTPENCDIPAECSLGVVHHKRPKKHFHWMLVSQRLNSQICWVDFQEVYGGCPNDAEFVFKLYTASESGEYTKHLKKNDLPENSAFQLSSIFEQTHTSDDYSYLTVWCSYGGLMFFSTLEKSNSISIEHSF